MDNQERILRSIASSLQQIAFSMVQLNNKFVEIGKLLNEDKEQEPDGD